MDKIRKITKIIKYVLITSIIIGIIVSLIACGVFTKWVVDVIKDTEELNANNMYDLLEETSYVYTSEGELLEQVESSIHRILVDYQSIPKHTIDAFVAIEDERFWEHSGIDAKRLLGVIWINYKTGSRQGASTISQQLAKNIYLSPEQTYERKIKDIYYAIQLEKQLTKQQILEGYLNTVYFGRGAYGIKAASETYFNKDVKDLTIEESVLLAGIPQNPSKYSLIKEIKEEDLKEDSKVIGDTNTGNKLVINYDIISRRDLVLNAMVKNELISFYEMEEIKNKNISEIVSYKKPKRYENTSYYIDMVYEEVIEELQKIGKTKEESEYLIQHGGLKIYTTIDLEKQQQLEEFYDNVKNFKSYNLKDINGEQIIQPQSAFVLLENNTGHIKAIIGGRGLGKNGRKLYNRALEPRQPGSSIKPLAVYVKALEKGYSPSTIVNESKVFYDKSNLNKPWPRNWHGGYRGRMTLRKSLEDSSNTVPVKILDEFGITDKASFKEMSTMLERLGITSFVTEDKPVIKDGKIYHDETYSTALGGMTYGVSPLEMAGAYSVFPNKGIYKKPTTLVKVIDRNNEVLIDNSKLYRRVVTEGVAYLMTDMLEGVVTNGLGKRASIRIMNKGIPVAGKTGTTSSTRDAWFVGFTPYYTASVWIGNDMNENLQQGSAMAAEIWSEIMQEFHKNLPDKDFDESKDIVEVEVNPNDGKIATKYTRKVKRIYPKGYEPTEVSEYVPPIRVTQPTVDIHENVLEERKEKMGGLGDIEETEELENIEETEEIENIEETEELENIEETGELENIEELNR